MKTLLIALIVLVLSACTTVSYESGDEKMSVTTLFKTIEDFSVIRTPDIFGIQIGSTNSETDAIESVAKILEFYANPVSAIK